MLKDYQKKILHLMEKVELSISVLYEIFTEKFPDLTEFWMALSREEKEHAKWVRGLCKFEEQGEILFHEDKVRIQTLNTYIEHLEKLIEKAKSGTMTLKAALSAAKDLEMSLIEKNMFSHFDSQSERMEEVLKLLGKKTKEHSQKLQNMIQKL